MHRWAECPNRRAALEAAWRASTVDPDDATEGVICYQREKAAVTIAAFLRRLAETSPCEIDAEISSELADAVEAAAREADHA